MVYNLFSIGGVSSSVRILTKGPWQPFMHPRVEGASFGYGNVSFSLLMFSAFFLFYDFPG